MLTFFGAMELQRHGPCMHGDQRAMTPAEIEEWRRKQMAEWMEWRNNLEKQRQHCAMMQNACQGAAKHSAPDERGGRE